MLLPMPFLLQANLYVSLLKRLTADTKKVVRVQIDKGAVVLSSPPTLHSGVTFSN